MARALRPRTRRNCQQQLNRVMSEGKKVSWDVRHTAPAAVDNVRDRLDAEERDRVEVARPAHCGGLHLFAHRAVRFHLPASSPNDPSMAILWPPATAPCKTARRPADAIHHLQLPGLALTTRKELTDPLTDQHLRPKTHCVHGAPSPEVVLVPVQRVACRHDALLES